MHAYARRILRLRDEAREKIAQTRDNTFRHISTGASTIPGSYIMPHALSALRDRYPQLIVHIRSGDSHDILEMVAADQVEIGFIGRGTADKRFSCEPIWKDTLVLVAGKDHQAARSKDIANLADLPFISREIGSGTRTIIETRFKAEDRWSGFNVVSEMGSSEAVKEAVLAGLGVSFLSVHAVRRELSQGLLKRVAWPGSPLSRDIFMVYKKQFKPLPRHDIFMTCMRAYRPND